MKLENKISLITGAGSGIGESTAKLFAKEGAKVILCDLKEANVKAIAEEIKAAGGEAYAMKMDVSSEEDWKKAAAFVMEKFGKLNTLVSNAGILASGLLVDTTLATWNECLAVNVTASFLAIKYLSPALIAGKNGSVIFTCSDASERGYANFGAYGASKGALKTFCRYAAAELYLYNVRCNTIHPAFVDTPMARSLVGTGESVADRDDYKNPLGRVLSPEDVASSMLYLASDDARNVNCCALLLEGGATNFFPGLVF